MRASCLVRAGCAFRVGLTFTILTSACRLETGQPASRGPRIDVATAPASNILDGAVDRFDPGVDYFPEKATFRHATQLRVEYHGHYKLVTFVSNTVHERLRYLLVQRGAPVPTEYAGALVFEVPARQFALASFRYGGAADLFGVTDRLIAFRARIATTPSIVKLIDQGLSDDFSPERMAALDPDVVISYYANASLSTSMNPYVPLGVREVSMAEHLEPTPLAKAEWIKFFAMFFNRESAAERHFAEVEAAYRRLAEQVHRVEHRPTVALNVPFRGRWQIAGGQNALARLIADAGGTYLFADEPSAASIRDVSFERALDRSLDADVWLIDAESSGRRDLAHALFSEAAVADAPAIREGRVWVCNLDPGDSRNPYWDQALPHPDWLLADLVHILHPEILGNHTPAFHTTLRPPSRNR
jgi:iron complex transport system substrate-binding protein